MFDVFELNYAIELWSIAFCVIGIACSFLLVRSNTEYRNLLIAMFLLELLAAAGDATTVVNKGGTEPYARVLLYVGNFAVFACMFLLQAAVTSYLGLRISESGGSAYRPWRRIVNLLSTAMSILTAFGVFYYFDDANMYHRGSLYWLSIVFVLVVSSANAVLVVINRKHLGATALTCLLMYTLAPIVASGIQAFVYGPNLAIAVGVLGLVVVFLEMQAFIARTQIEQTETIAQTEAEAMESRTAAMLSQIQPHFLFNTLDTIYGLADEDVALAKDTIASFSRYLRTNLASINRTEPVPLQTEIEHTRNYLELERVSDPQRISYELDIATTDFSVPVLSIQTLVENAIKHGLNKRAAGGTVSICTREQSNEYTVTISDDGVGFDVESVAQDNETHFGLENTRSRLAAMCGGTLDVTSEVGVGTRVVMHIPKEQS